MNFGIFAALACIVLWVVLAFVAAFPTGWVHVPLIVGVLLAAKAIVDSKPAG